MPHGTYGSKSMKILGCEIGMSNALDSGAESEFMEDDTLVMIRLGKMRMIDIN